MSETTGGGKKTTTGSVSRAMGGVGTFIDPHHEGDMEKRGPENRLIIEEEKEGDQSSDMPRERVSVFASEDGSEVVTTVNGKIVKREKRLPPGLR